VQEGTTIGMRSSNAAATITVLPDLELPVIRIFSGSTLGTFRK